MARTQNLHDLLDMAAVGHADCPAITVQGCTRSYRQLHSDSLTAGHWLREAGLSGGQRLVVQADNPQLPELVFAASRTGAVVAPIHPHVKGNTLRHIMSDCQPAMVITDKAEWTKTADRLGYCVTTDYTTAGTAAACMPARPAPADSLLMIYTSGSTGMPKAVVATHEQALFAIDAISRQLQYRPGDVVFTPAPLSFDYGLYQLFLSASAGCHMWAASPTQRGPGMASAIVQSQATILAAVPSTVDILVAQLRRGRSTPTLRLVTTTGAAMAASALRTLRSVLPTAAIQVMYGLTECKRVSIMPPDGDLAKPGSCGVPMPGTEVFAIDDEGRRVPDGIVGELVVRGPHVMSGYWADPVATARVFAHHPGRPRQLRTGDFGYVDEDGYLFVHGRRDDLYKVLGMRVSGVEVAHAARRIHGVHDAIVLPPGMAAGHAILVAVADLRPAEIISALRNDLEDFKVPDQCVVVHHLPSTINGKVDRRKLAETIAGGDLR